jgi:hypothetical protein
MPLHELHPFTDAEIALLPHQPGMYVLFQIENPIHADGAQNLRKDVRAAKTKFPHATHFSIETLDAPALAQRLEALRKELKLVRKAGFIGSRP